MLLSLSEEQETSEWCLVLTDPCSWSDRLPVWPMPKWLPVWPMPEGWCSECGKWVRLEKLVCLLTFELSEFVTSWKTSEYSDQCSACKFGMLRCCLWTLCSNCTELPGELRTGSSDLSRHLSIFSFWASWPVKTGRTESPSVTESPGMSGKTRCTWCGQRTRFTRRGCGNRVLDTGYRIPEPGTGH